MTKLIVDAALRDRLQDLHESVELCDESGRVLGRFMPAPLELRDDSGQVVGHFYRPVVDLTEWEPVTPDVSEEELDRREQSTEWYTTEQVLEHLRNLEKP